MTESIYSRQNLENANRDLPRPCVSLWCAKILLVKLNASIVMVYLVSNGMLGLNGMLGNSRVFKVIFSCPLACSICQCADKVTAGYGTI